MAYRQLDKFTTRRLFSCRLSENVCCWRLQGTKIYGKSSLKYVPLIGWAWMFTESIFLRRDWDQDKQTITRDLKCIRDYPDGYWVTVGDSNTAAVNCKDVIDGMETV